MASERPTGGTGAARPMARRTTAVDGGDRGGLNGVEEGYRRGWGQGEVRGQGAHRAAKARVEALPDVAVRDQRSTAGAAGRRRRGCRKQGRRGALVRGDGRGQGAARPR